MLVKFSTIGNGLFLEVPKDGNEYHDATRCFRFDSIGNSEYAFLKDIKENGDRARFYHHMFKESDFIFA